MLIGARVLGRTPPLSSVLLTSGWGAGLSGDQRDGGLEGDFLARVVRVTAAVVLKH